MQRMHIRRRGDGPCCPDLLGNVRHVQCRERMPIAAAAYVLPARHQLPGRRRPGLLLLTRTGVSIGMVDRSDGDVGPRRGQSNVQWRDDGYVLAGRDGGDMLPGVS